MSRIYHGTSYENYLDIIKEGKFKTKRKTWTCSYSNYTYFYRPGMFIKHNDCHDIDCAIRCAIQEAFGNAFITAAINKSLSDKVVVLELEVPQRDICEDSSCDGMYVACQVHNDDLDISMIKRVLFNAYSPITSILYMAGLHGRHYINLDLTPIEEAIIKQLNRVEVFPEELWEVDYYEAEKEIS